jgi:hypothetical protein
MSMHGNMFVGKNLRAVRDERKIAKLESGINAAFVIFMVSSVVLLNDDGLNERAKHKKNDFKTVIIPTCRSLQLFRG